jgi:hypothetical protein
MGRVADTAPCQGLVRDNHLGLDGQLKGNKLTGRQWQIGTGSDLAGRAVHVCGAVVAGDAAAKVRRLGPVRQRERKRPILRCRNAMCKACSGQRDHKGDKKQRPMQGKEGIGQHAKIHRAKAEEASTGQNGAGHLQVAPHAGIC